MTPVKVSDLIESINKFISKPVRYCEGYWEFDHKSKVKNIYSSVIKHVEENVE